MATRVRGVYGGPLAKLAKLTEEIPKEVLLKVAKVIVDSVVDEARKDFAKRGWSLNDPKGGPPLDKSFSYSIRGDKTIEITSTYWGLTELQDGIPRHPMTWLTQEGRDKSPTKHELPPAERRKSIHRGPKGKNRKPLVVPLKTDAGTVIFRTAPLMMKDAWIHPGIAKFTFLERGIQKGRKKAALVLFQFLKDHLS